MRLLLEAGAAAYPVDRQGKTPLDIAVEQGHVSLFSLLKPLHAAAERGDAAAARAVVQREPSSVSVRDETGSLALHLAGAAGHVETVSLLAAAGADVNARAACGETPLRVALAAGRNEAAAFLRSKGASDQSDPTTGYGEGFVVTVDGLTVFYGGDHQSSERLWPAFTREIDFLQQQGLRRRLPGVLPTVPPLRDRGRPADCCSERPAARRRLLLPWRAGAGQAGNRLTRPGYSVYLGRPPARSRSLMISAAR